MLIDHANNGLVLSIDRVKVELERGKDELAEWASGSFHEHFASTEEEDVIAAYRRIMVWSQGQAQFTPGAKAEFARVADGLLVAYALAKVCIVVTHEQFNLEAKARIKIPNVCQAFGVQYIDTFQMMLSWESGWAEMPDRPLPSTLINNTKGTRLKLCRNRRPVRTWVGQLPK